MTTAAHYFGVNDAFYNIILSVR